MATSSLQLVALLCMVCMTSLVAGQPDLSICDPANYTYPYDGPPLPTLPSQYYLKVEASITNKRYSMILEEFYDDINNRGACIAPVKNHSTIYTSYDYGLDQIVRVTIDNAKGNASCTVSDLANTRFNLFGFHVENGRGHINGSSAVFRFGQEFNETYMGKTTVRGIAANRWQRCVYLPEFTDTFLLDFYFSDPEFHLAYGASQVPLRATVSGSAFNRTTSERRTFSHNYEYLEVNPGPVKMERAFEPPLGVHCSGYKRVKSFPVFPDIFSFRVESVHKEQNAIHFIKENYNYPAKLVSYTYQPWNSTAHKYSGTVREVHDYNLGVSYKMDYVTDECSIGPIPVDMYPHDANSSDGKHVSLRSPYNFLLHNQTKWIYEGNATLRDVDVEAWITSGQHSNTTNRWNFTMEYFFARGNWTADGRTQDKVQQMPMQFKYTSLKSNNDIMFSVVQNIYQFSPSISNHDFDVHSCYSEMDSRIAAVDIIGFRVYQNYVVNNTHTFYAAAQAALANASGLPATRISNLYAAEGADEILILYFEILDVPRVAGNAVNMSRQPSLAEGFIKLEESNLVDTPIIISFMQGEQKVILPIIPGSLRISFHPSNQKSTGISQGAAAGVGIAMFIIGAVVATVIAYVYYKRVVDPPVPYGVQN